MNRISVYLSALFFVFLSLLLSDRGGFAQKNPVDFARDIEPVLKARCYSCHGDTQQAGGLRLDSRASLLRGGSGGAAITPGNAAKSTLLSRLTGQDGKPRMPLGFAPLSDAQIQLFRDWINQGAVWNETATPKLHWAYQPLKRPAVPTVKTAGWVRNPIDAFVLARLEKEGLRPSPEADKTTLLRRVTLDLTGLPPTPQEVDAFNADRSPQAYDKVVDRLLASQHYGERMAMPWLDAARYADSNGFQQDGDTYQYIWRDWVVSSLNADMPFDRFTILQLAGDLLPGATDAERLATAFSRCHLLNGEGGAIPEEQRNVVLFDRVDVTATTWLGITVACAQCHDHKYDPITQRDYYSFLAYFNNVPESGVPPGGGQYRIAEPAMMVASDVEQAKLHQLEENARVAQQAEQTYLTQQADAIRTAQGAWEADTLRQPDSKPTLDTWQGIGPFPADTFDAAYATAFPAEMGFQANAAYADGKLKWMAHPEWADGKPQVLTGENSAFYLYRVIHIDQPRVIPLSLGSDDAIKVWLNGKPILANKIARGVQPNQERVTLDLQAGENQLLIKIINGGGVGGFYFNLLSAGVPPEILAIIKTEEAKRTPENAAKLRTYFLANQPPVAYKPLAEATKKTAQERDIYRATIPRVMVMSDAQPRKTHILQRGNYEMPGEEVAPSVPAFLPQPPTGTPKNRLGLAQWLVSSENPLTARVQVNRLWQIFFNNGLVKTSENLGVQSPPPTHPELLDWLSITFREPVSNRPDAYAYGWSIKRLVRLIVTSATYRQSSRVTPELHQRDPENKLLARGARFRLPSLVLRDVALSASGLLNPAIGGKPVYPYQPIGIWDGLAITKERDFTYPQSKGSDLYRRSLYTFWRRTVAPANMFDASVRNTCKVRVSTTNTPLHALVTLNDVTWVEASRALAERLLEIPGLDPGSRLKEAFRRICGRRPTPAELAILERSLLSSLITYGRNPAEAEKLLKVGDSPANKQLDPAEHAAYTSVCLAIFNLDEALTRE